MINPKNKPVRSALSVLSAAMMAALMTIAATPAQSQSVLGLSGVDPGAGGGASVAAAPAGALPPATRGTKPYRMTADGVCKVNTCTYAFRPVADNKLLEIQNVSCFAQASESQPAKFAVLSTTADFGANGLVAILPSTQLIPIDSSVMFLLNATGPYFFRGGEGVFILSAGGSGRCTISGYLSRTD